MARISRENPPIDVPVVDIDPFADAFLASPDTFHPALRDAGPVVWFERLGIYGMARHAEVSAALKDWETFSSARGVGLADFSKEPPWRPQSLLLEADPPLHNRTRRIMNKVVTLPALKAVRDDWAAKADRLVAALVARRRFDAVTELAEAFPLLVFPDTIGLRQQGRDHLIPYATAAFNAFGPRNHLLESTALAAAEASLWVNESCERRHLAPGGWGEMIYRAADSGECGEEEAGRLVRSLLTAGVDTTINGIGNMLHAFALHPDQWDVLRRDPSLTKRAFEESLRWDSTVQTFFRTTRRSVEIEGTTIPEGAKVLLFLAAANRDPRRWPDADAFDIRRMASGHVGFGFGIHQCLGQMMARQEAELVLDALIPRIRAFQLTGRPVRRLNNTLHALAHLPIEVEPA